MPARSASCSPARTPRTPRAGSSTPGSSPASQRDPWRARRDDANVLQGLRLSGSPSDVAQQVRAALARPTSLVRVIDLLRQMDDRNTGVVERAEWGKALRELGFVSSSSDADAVFASFDLNSDGRIQYQELWRVLRRGGSPLRDNSRRGGCGVSPRGHDSPWGEESPRMSGSPRGNGSLQIDGSTRSDEPPLAGRHASSGRRGASPEGIASQRGGSRRGASSQRGGSPVASPMQRGKAPAAWAPDAGSAGQAEGDEYTGGGGSGAGPSRDCTGGGGGWAGPELDDYVADRVSEQVTPLLRDWSAAVDSLSAATRPGALCSADFSSELKLLRAEVARVGASIGRAVAEQRGELVRLLQLGMEGQAGVAEEAKAAREAVGRLSAQFKKVGGALLAEAGQRAKLKALEGTPNRAPASPPPQSPATPAPPRAMSPPPPDGDPSRSRHESQRLGAELARVRGCLRQAEQARARAEAGRSEAEAGQRKAEVGLKDAEGRSGRDGAVRAELEKARVELGRLKPLLARAREEAAAVGQASASREAVAREAGMREGARDAALEAAREAREAAIREAAVREAARAECVREVASARASAQFELWDLNRRLQEAEASRDALIDASNRHVHSQALLVGLASELEAAVAPGFTMRAAAAAAVDRHAAATAEHGEFLNKNREEMDKNRDAMAQAAEASVSQLRELRQLSAAAAEARRATDEQAACARVVAEEQSRREEERAEMWRQREEERAEHRRVREEQRDWSIEGLRQALGEKTREADRLKIETDRLKMEVDAGDKQVEVLRKGAQGLRADADELRKALSTSQSSVSAQSQLSSALASASDLAASLDSQRDAALAAATFHTTAHSLSATAAVHTACSQLSAQLGVLERVQALSEGLESIVGRLITAGGKVGVATEAIHAAAGCLDASAKAVNGAAEGVNVAVERLGGEAEARARHGVADAVAAAGAREALGGLVAEVTAGLATWKLQSTRVEAEAGVAPGHGAGMEVLARALGECEAEARREREGWAAEREGWARERQALAAERVGWGVERKALLQVREALLEEITAARAASAAAVVEAVKHAADLHVASLVRVQTEAMRVAHETARAEERQRWDERMGTLVARVGEANAAARAATAEVAAARYAFRDSSEARQMLDARQSDLLHSLVSEVRASRAAAERAAEAASASCHTTQQLEHSLAAAVGGAGAQRAQGEVLQTVLREQGSVLRAEREAAHKDREAVRARAEGAERALEAQRAVARSYAARGEAGAQAQYAATVHEWGDMRARQESIGRSLGALARSLSPAPGGRHSSGSPRSPPVDAFAGTPLLSPPGDGTMAAGL